MGTAPDGQRFLVIAPLQDNSAQSRPITIVVNWMQGIVSR